MIDNVKVEGLEVDHLSGRTKQEVANVAGRKTASRFQALVGLWFLL